MTWPEQIRKEFDVTITHVLSDGTVLTDITGRLVPAEGKALIAYKVLQEFYQKKMQKPISSTLESKVVTA